MTEPIANTILRAAGEESIARFEAMLPNITIERENPTFEFPAEVLQEANEIARKEG